MPCIPLHQTWQIYPPSIEHACLVYHYTKLGRSTSRSHIWQICLADLPPSIEHRCLAYCYTTHGRSTGRSTPCQSSIDALHTITPHIADLHPSQLSIDALHTITPNMAALLAGLPTPQSSIDALHTITPNMADLLADLPPGQLSIDALHTTTPNLTDLPPPFPSMLMLYQYENYRMSSRYKKYADSAVQAQYHFSIFIIST